MRRNRKQEVARRAAKENRQVARKSGTLDRLLQVTGLTKVFDKLPQGIRQTFQNKFGPGLEVIAAQDSSDDLEIKKLSQYRHAALSR